MDIKRAVKFTWIVLRIIFAGIFVVTALAGYFFFAPAEDDSTFELLVLGWMLRPSRYELDKYQHTSDYGIITLDEFQKREERKALWKERRRRLKVFLLLLMGRDKATEGLGQ